MRFYYPLSGLLALLLTGYQTTAQTTPADTTRISYEEEVQPLAPSAEDAAPLRLQHETNQQWKLGLNNFLLGSPSPNYFYNRIGVHIAYERKLNSALAVQAELSPAVVRYRQDDGQLNRALGARVQLMGRYYHNLERRIRKGKGQGSFSGNYIALALGSKLGRHTYETPFYFLSPNANGRGSAADVALLYGWQRRLGRRGFVDANVGLTKLLSPIESEIGLSGSLRVGLLLGTPAELPQPSTQLTADDNAQLRQRFYVGTQLGSYNYQVRFSGNDPYAARPGSLPSVYLGNLGVGSYSVEVKTPYYYAGYQVRPRLALQLGYQGQARTYNSSGVYFSGGLYAGKESKTYEQTLAFPVLARYSLTRQYLKRLQFDVVGGAALVYARVRNQETRYDKSEVIEQYAFGRHTTGTHLTGGLDASYGIGRRRKLQLTAEYVLIQSLQSASSQRPINAGVSFGLRYRFGPTF
ncbi:hypothetical protein [Hymenobacter aerophilus]|uniref:hypothetical protein n=1 Tax=Hymenobacter aerophilus TaxID=119644 RepID=UPI00036FBE19|nr:hypothetical protein [Hymenobacter aerophilus]